MGDEDGTMNEETPLASDADVDAAVAESGFSKSAKGSAVGRRVTQLEATLKRLRGDNRHLVGELENTREALLRAQNSLTEAQSAIMELRESVDPLKLDLEKKIFQAGLELQALVKQRLSAPLLIGGLAAIVGYVLGGGSL
jgi:chromosome segregation ATPase